ncbi:hypothetical protein Hanom_Chr07g00632961 [Helianthus anomalus]
MKCLTERSKNRVKSGQLGDRVVYTCRVVVEYAKWVELVMDQLTYGNPNAQRYVIYRSGQRSPFVFFNVFFCHFVFFRVALRYEALVLQVLNYVID